MLNGVVWNRTVLTFNRTVLTFNFVNKNYTYIKLNCLKFNSALNDPKGLIAIVPWSTQAQSGNIWLGPIYESNWTRTVLTLKVCTYAKLNCLK